MESWHGESNLVVDAAMFLLCVVSEIHDAAHYGPEPRLVETWAYLRESDDDVQHLWATRYEGLLIEGGA